MPLYRSDNRKPQIPHPQYTQFPNSFNYPIRASDCPRNEPTKERPSGICAPLDAINEYRRIMGILVVQVFSVCVF